MRPFPRQEVPHIGKNKARAGESRYREMIIFRISLVKKREGGKERYSPLPTCQSAFIRSTRGYEIETRWLMRFSVTEYRSCFDELFFPHMFFAFFAIAD